MRRIPLLHQTLSWFAEQPNPADVLLGAASPAGAGSGAAISADFVSNLIQYAAHEATEVATPQAILCFVYLAASGEE